VQFEFQLRAGTNLHRHTKPLLSKKKNNKIKRETNKNKLFTVKAAFAAP